MVPALPLSTTSRLVTADEGRCDSPRAPLVVTRLCVCSSGACLERRGTASCAPTLGRQPCARHPHYGRAPSLQAEPLRSPRPALSAAPPQPRQPRGLHI